jgi:hypothetical protein
MIVFRRTDRLASLIQYAADGDMGLLASLPRPCDYFQCSGLTAVFGSRAATECGLKFFGPDQVVFASDAPFDQRAVRSHQKR